MAADPNIFSQYLQPVKSMNDRLAALDAREMAGLQLQGQRRQNDFLGAQQAEQLASMERANQDRNIFQRAVQSSGGDQNALIRALEGSGSQGLMKVSQEMRKALEEAANKASSTAKNNADADKERLLMAKTRGEMVLQAVSAAKDPASYQQALQWLGSQGMDVSNLPQQYDPAFVENSGRQAMTIVQRADQEWKAKGYQLDVQKADQQARNDLVLPSGAINKPLLDAKQMVAKAGASNVSINTGQRGLDNEFKLRGEFKQEPVYKAHQEMQAAHGQIKQAIAQASPAGDLAAATKIMKLLDPGSVVRESELGMAMQASGLMDRVTNYGSMVLSGQKLTPTQRKDFQSLADRLMTESVQSYNSKRSEYERLGGEYGLNAPRALGPNAPSVAPKNDATTKPVAVLKFDANGNPVK